MTLIWNVNYTNDDVIYCKQNEELFLCLADWYPSIDKEWNWANENVRNTFWFFQKTLLNQSYWEFPLGPLDTHHFF